MSKVRSATIANLTFVVGQLEELKSNVNDTMRYIKQNGEEWDICRAPAGALQISMRYIKQNGEE